MPARLNYSGGGCPMKRLAMLLVILFSSTLFVVTVNAQSRVEVCQAELYHPYRASRGKIVKVGNALVFVDDLNMRSSFAIDRSYIRRSVDQEGLYAVSMPFWRDNRYGNYSRFDFRLISGDCDRIAQWLYYGRTGSY